MERKNGVYLGVIIALVVAIVGMSIGFAFTDIELKIDGDVTTKAQKWDVHFNPESINVTSGSVNATTAANAVATEYLTATYKVTLAKVGDFYEFTIDAKNFGDFNAKLSNISITGGTDYLTHTVKYNGSAISAGTVNGTTLVPGASDTYTVRVEYIEPDDESKLPSSDVTNTYNVTLTYTQVA